MCNVSLYEVTKHMTALKGGTLLDEFKQLYDKHEKQIYKYLFYLVGNKHLAEELTQETFFQAFKSIHRFKGESKVSTWLFQIAKNTYYTYMRKNKKIDRNIDPATIQESLAFQQTPEEIYEKKEESIHLMNAIKKLKQPQQEIMILRFYNELSFNEIGDIFDKTDLWARVNFYRAKGKLSNILDGGVET
jgi:RNA polymerase sigma-70 factor, ECF subfamily